MNTNPIVDPTISRVDARMIMDNAYPTTLETWETEAAYALEDSITAGGPRDAMLEHKLLDVNGRLIDLEATGYDVSPVM